MSQTETKCHKMMQMTHNDQNFVSIVSLSKSDWFWMALRDSFRDDYRQKRTMPSYVKDVSYLI